MYVCRYQGNETSKDAEDLGKIIDKAWSRSQEGIRGRAYIWFNIKEQEFGQKDKYRYKKVLMEGLEITGVHA